MQRRGSSAPLLPGLSQDEAPAPDDPSAHLAEEACLFYVALTRAQDELVLSWAEFYGRMRYRVSPFLAPIGAALGARLGREQWAPTLPPPASRPSPLPAASRALQGPVRHSEIETYQRCPRQYAYRYVYNLQPREIGLATLRYVLHATLGRLQRRLARLDRGHASGERTAGVSLQEAQNLFQSEWEKKLEQERRIQRDDEAGDAASQLEESRSILGDAFLEVYRRHGMQVVERAWREMMQHQPAESSPPAPDSSGVAFDTQETHFDEQVTVQVRGRELSVVLDRVERGIAGDSPDSPVGEPNGASVHERRAAGRGKSGASVPLRLVRHRLGNNGVGKPDLHALFYALAAQQGGSQSTELYSHNLTTGELDRVVLDERKIAKLHDELDSILEGIESGYFPPRPDPNLCASCPFLLICPA
jgi:DNA helicase II / ATP-dependent DNA helicase PcrA